MSVKCPQGPGGGKKKTDGCPLGTYKTKMAARRAIRIKGRLYTVYVTIQMIVSFASARAGVKQCSLRPSKAKASGEKDGGSCVTQRNALPLDYCRGGYLCELEITVVAPSTLHLFPPTFPSPLKKMGAQRCSVFPLSGGGCG